MKKITLSILSLLALPFVTHAQTLQNFITNVVGFLGDTVISFLIVVAFLFFVINVIRYFVIGSTNEKGREKAKALAIYGVLGFVLIIIFQGVVNLLSSSIGLDGENQPTPDYYDVAP